ncbi:Uncharacterised protein [Shigella sonnei]|nr:Uncharacterised protein [Shigella sonnei]
MRCKTLNEIIHITAQESTTAKTNFGCTVAEDIVSINTHKVGIGDRIHRHAGNDPYPQP